MLYYKLKTFEYDARLPLNVIIMRPQPPVVLHHHDFMEIVFIYSGKGVCFTKEGSCSISRGDVLITRPGESHGYRKTKELVLGNLIYDPLQLPIAPLDMEKTNIYQVMMNKHQDQPAKSTAPHPFLKLTSDTLEMIWNELLSLMNRRRKTEVGNLFRCFVNFQNILGMLACYDNYDLRNHEETYKNLELLTEYLELHYEEAISNQKMAQIAQMSKRTLLRHFRKFTGTTPVNYLINIRIQHALQFIRNSDQPINSMAFAVGFNSNSYFTRCFRKVTGLSPSSFSLKAQLRRNGEPPPLSEKTPGPCISQG